MQVLALTRLCGLAIVGHASFARAEDEFVGCRIADSASDRNSVLHHGDRNAKLGDALHELPSAVERIDNPDALFVEPSEIVHGLFREPAFARAEKRLSQNVVHSAVGLGDGIASNFVFGFNGAGSEAVEHDPRRFEPGVNAFE